MLEILSIIYSFFAERKNLQFDSGKIPIFKPKTAVISIGNISSGGTGKTPLTMYLAKFLLKNGFRPGIISRGWKGKFKDTLVVSDGKKILCSQAEAGDELYMLAQNVQCPIVANKQKYLAAKEIERRFDLDCIIVDDGFQHRRLYRDLDIIIIDSATINNPFALPKGRLRENISGIKRADIVCHTVSNEEIQRFLLPFQKSFITAQLATKTVGFYSVTEPTKVIETYGEAFIFSGIARHEKFRTSITEAGIKISEELIFGDHHDYSLHDVKRIIQEFRKSKSCSLITTEKDAVKLAKYCDQFQKETVELVYLKIESFVSYNEESFKNAILSTLKQRK